MTIPPSNPYGEPYYGTQPEMGHFPHPPTLRQRKRWPWVLGAVVVVLFAACGLGLAALAGGGAAVNHAVATVEASQSAAASNRALDIRISSCKVDSYGTVTIGYTVKNSNKYPQSYTPHFNVVKGSQVYGDAYDFVENLAPGKTYNGKAIGEFNGDKASGVKCILLDA